MRTPVLHDPYHTCVLHMCMTHTARALHNPYCTCALNESDISTALCVYSTHTVCIHTRQYILLLVLVDLLFRACANIFGGATLVH